MGVAVGVVEVTALSSADGGEDGAGDTCFCPRALSSLLILRSWMRGLHAQDTSLCP